MSATNRVTNNDLLEIMQELMQLTSNGFERLETRVSKLESQMVSVQVVLEQHGQTLGAHGRLLAQHGALLHEHSSSIANLQRTVDDMADKHAAYVHDIRDILDRLVSLEQRTSHQA